MDSGKSIQLELSTPLGVTLASARVDAQGASLVTADGKRYSARSGEDLTEQLFGWRIPVQRLPAWFNGKPARITETLSRQDMPDQPIAGEEDGWLIRYELWVKEKPYKVLLSVPERVTLRMILDD